MLRLDIRNDFRKARDEKSCYKSLWCKNESLGRTGNKKSTCHNFRIAKSTFLWNIWFFYYLYIWFGVSEVLWLSRGLSITQINFMYTSDVKIDHTFHEIWNLCMCFFAQLITASKVILMSLVRGVRGRRSSGSDPVGSFIDCYCGK